MVENYWLVGLDKEGKWHCFHRYSCETYEATHLPPGWLAQWMIPAPTRGCALGIAKRDWQESQRENVELAEAGLEEYAERLRRIDAGCV